MPLSQEDIDDFTSYARQAVALYCRHDPTYSSRKAARHHFNVQLRFCGHPRRPYLHDGYIRRYIANHMIEILLDAGQITIQTDADAAAAAAARQENEKAELTDGHSTEMDISDEQVSLPSPKDLEGWEMCEGKPLFKFDPPLCGDADQRKKIAW